MKQGFSEKSVTTCSGSAKNMNEHERYIRDFQAAAGWHELLGPGDSLFTQQQFAALPSQPRRIFDMGCGRRRPALAQVTDATMVAIDLDEEALAAVARSASAAGLSQVIPCAPTWRRAGGPGPRRSHLAEGERLHHRGGQRLAAMAAVPCRS